MSNYEKLARAWLISASITVGHTGAIRSADAASRQSQDAIMNQVRAAFERFDQTTANSSGRVELSTSRNQPTGSFSFGSIIDFKRRGANTWYQCQYHGTNDDLGELYVSNEQYSFLLKRASPNSPWKLIGVYPKQKRPRVFDDHNRKFGPYCIEDIWLPDDIASDRFKILGVTSSNENGEDLLKVQFQRERKNDSDRVISGSASLATKHNWAVRSFSVSVRWGSRAGRIESKTDINESAKGNVTEYVVSSQLTALDTPGATSETTKVRFTLESPPIGDFYLSSFGFAEPPEFEKSRSRVWWYVLVLAVFFMFSVVAWRRWFTHSG